MCVRCVIFIVCYLPIFFSFSLSLSPFQTLNEQRDTYVRKSSFKNKKKWHCLGSVIYALPSSRAVVAYGFL